MGSEFSTYGAKRNTYRLLVVEPEGNRSLARYGLREDNIKKEFRDICSSGTD
jgi:hypothetical protein